MGLTTISGRGIMWDKAPERKDDSLQEENVRTAESDLQTELLIRLYVYVNHLFEKYVKEQDVLELGVVVHLLWI
jgi:hypothetical protein